MSLLNMSKPKEPKEPCHCIDALPVSAENVMLVAPDKVKRDTDYWLDNGKTTIPNTLVVVPLFLRALNVEPLTNNQTSLAPMV